jgi:glycosyltransferase involved in cell wall biosynthesis
MSREAGLAGPLNVLQVHARYRSRGGEDTTVDNERLLLADAGHRVELFEAQNPEERLESAVQLARSPWNRRAARQLERRIESLRPDVVHVHNTWFSLSPSVLSSARRAGCAVVMTLQNYRLVCVSSNLFRDSQLCEDCVGRGPWRGVAHRCYRDSAALSGVLAAQIQLHRSLGTWRREVDVYVAVSRFGIARHRAGGVPAERIVVKDNFAPDPGPRAAAPSASGDVLFAGRDAPEKGLEELIGYWRAAAPAGLRLLIAGPDALPPGSAGAGIELLGPLPPEAVAERMRAARALLIPSRWPEGQPLVLLEALAAGLPVLGSDVGGIGEVLADADPRARVPLDDAQAWTGALRALADDALVDALGRESRELYERALERRAST